MRFLHLATCMTQFHVLYVLSLTVVTLALTVARELSKLHIDIHYVNKKLLKVDLALRSGQFSVTSRDRQIY